MKQQCSKTKLGVSGVRMFQDSFMYLVQFSSVAQSCPTLCKPVNRSMPGLPVHHRNTTSYWTMSKLRYITSRVNTVLVSQDCHNKLPQTGCLKTTEIYSLRVLGVRGPK